MSDETIELANGTITANKLERLLELREEEEIKGTGDAVVRGVYELADDGYDDDDCILRQSSGWTVKKLHDDYRVSVEELRERVNEATEDTFEDYIESADWFYGSDEIRHVHDNSVVVFFDSVVSHLQMNSLLTDDNVGLGFIGYSDAGGVLVEIFDER